MTPTTSSTTILLGNPSAPAAKTGATSSAEPTSGAAVDGFELLLGEMQHLSAELSKHLVATKADGSDDAANGEASGNESPQIGMLLPSLQIGLAPGQDAGKLVEPKESSDADSKTQTDGDVNAAALALPVMLTLPQAQKSVGAMSDATVDNGTALAGVGADAKGARSTNPLQAATTLSSNSAAGDPTLTTALASASIAEMKDPSAGTKPSESDFDLLVKQLDVTNSTSASMPLADSSGSSQVTRAYADTVSSTATVSTPVGSSGWSDAVADKVMWFSANKLSSAEIHLNPPDLGPLQVRISTQHDQASVMFTSQHAAVRDALDQALPRLREMMGSQGMHLLDVSVGGQNPQQQQQQYARQQQGDRSGAFAGMFGDDASDAALTTRVTTIDSARFIRSGVDAYV